MLSRGTPDPVAAKDQWLCDVTHPGEPCPADRPAARRYRSMVPKRSPAQMLDALYQAIEDSRKSLSKIGEGDWTPQDTAHSVLLARIEAVLANVPFRTGRIVHGDAE